MVFFLYMQFGPFDKYGVEVRDRDIDEIPAPMKTQTPVVETVTPTSTKTETLTKTETSAKTDKDRELYNG